MRTIGVLLALLGGVMTLISMAALACMWFSREAEPEDFMGLIRLLALPIILLVDLLLAIVEGVRGRSSMFRPLVIALGSGIVLLVAGAWLVKAG